uniref:Lantibiotic ABC transporter permease n=1 Tax=Syphacia muris TaxID=451379 RepID=A0A0N5B162_9BILA
MSVRSAFVCQLQSCNVLLILLGLAAVGLAGSQFSKVFLENYRDIDLRLLNWIYVLAGVIGIYTLLRNHGSIVTKTLYCISVIIGITTSVFYGITIYKVVQTYKSLKSLENISGFYQEYSEEASNHVGKIVICALMIGIPALAALTAIVATVLLDRLIIVAQPSWPRQSHDQEILLRNRRIRLTSISLIKLFLALGTLGLAIFLEYEHEKVSGNDNYIKIALDHISALFAVTSAIVDIYAVFNKEQAILNFKVSIALSVIAAVWCLKSIDNGMYPFYYNDLEFYQTSQEGILSSYTGPRYIISVVHGVLLSCFCLLFLLCLITVVQAGRCLQSDFVSVKVRMSEFYEIQSRIYGTVLIFASLCLMALVVMGLVNLPWNGVFVGGDLLWLVVLFFCTGILGILTSTSLLSIRFVLAVATFAIALEKMCVSINLVYQSATYESFKRGDNDTYIGQIVLYSVQLGIFFFTALVSLALTVLSGRCLVQQEVLIQKQPVGLQICLSFGVLFYGVVMTGCYVVGELGKWRFSETSLEVPFYRLANGPFAIAVFFIQIISIWNPQLLIASITLQISAAALAFFTLSSAITNTYYIQQLLSANDVIRTNANQNTIYIVAVALAASASLACVLCTFFETISALRSSYILHYKSSNSDSTVLAPLEESYGTMGTVLNSQTRSVTGQPMQQQVIQEREEQSVYWSADENPYFYQASKRYYGQPYQIESGFYCYSMASPRLSPEQNGYFDSDTQNVHSTAAQTRIGHVFH